MSVSASPALERILNAHFGVTVSSFVDEIAGGLFYVHISSKESFIRYGFAESFSEEEALQKAYSEFVERSVFESRWNNLELTNTSGMAAHPDSAKAAENAAFELIERDAFLVCWLGRRPPCWLSKADVLSLSGYASSCLDGFRKHGMEPLIGIVGVNNGIFVVCGALRGNGFIQPFGYVVTTSAGGILTDCVEKTILTLARYANSFVTRAKRQLPLVRFRECNGGNSTDFHLNEALDPRSISRCGWFFDTSPDIIDLPPFDLSIVELTVEVPLAFPRTVVLASAECAQSFFIGPTTDNVVNMARLRKVFGNEVDINFDVHPLL